MNPTAPISVTDRFVMILEGIYAATAARFKSVGWTVAMVWAVCNRVRRVERRVVKLLALYRAGVLPAEVASVRRSRAAEQRNRNAAMVVLPRCPTAKLPRRFGWLLPLVPCVAANLASQLQGVLAEPQMAGLLAASPSARRALRPVCRMLAIEMPVFTTVVIAAEPDGGSAVPVSGFFDVARGVVGCQAEPHPPRCAPVGRGPPLPA